MFRSKKYRVVADAIDTNKEYGIEAALTILQKSKLGFDQTVEVHMNLGVDPKHSDQVVRGTVVLPHGTGKKVRVIVFCKGNNEQIAKDSGAEMVGADELVAKIQGGWLDFDAVVATPDMMPVISKVAKILGPRGLMPSPKNGTVTPNVAQVIKELKAGKINYRVDKGANVHAPVGKLSFAVNQLSENILSVLDSVKKAKPSTSKGVYIKSLYLTSTMSPSIKLEMALTR